MKCPNCKSLDNKVNDSRLTDEGLRIRRRRECLNCQHRFTTYEQVELVMPRIIKRSGIREQFNEDKIRRGVLRAIEKRQITNEQFETSIEKIKLNLSKSGDSEIDASNIGTVVMDELLELDEVAYVRFASVYKGFNNIQQFLEIIDKIKK
jgi:transcriptional repressor NrdR